MASHNSPTGRGRLHVGDPPADRVVYRCKECQTGLADYQARLRGLRNPRLELPSEWIVREEIGLVFKRIEDLTDAALCAYLPSSVAVWPGSNGAGRHARRRLHYPAEAVSLAG